MKPPPFRYWRPESVDEALTTLASLGPSAKVLAGGQSLVPLLSMRLAAPAHLVDIGRLAGLAYIRVEADKVRVGALARQAQVLRDEAAAAAQPLLRQALRHVAHPAIRNRGTVVGSLVHADPAGEMTAVLALLGGTVRLASTGGERLVDASEFFAGPMESAVRPGELATEAVFPSLPPRSGTAFTEVSMRKGDYAISGVAAQVWLGDDGRVCQARAAYLAAGPRPLVIDLTAAVEQVPPGADGFGEAAALARAAVDPGPDVHATAGYRRHLAGVLTERALRGAAAHAARRAAEGEARQAGQAAAGGTGGRGERGADE